MRRALSAAVVACVILFAVSAAAAGTSPRPHELIFVRGHGADAELYAVATDGKGLRRLTRNRVPDFSPAWAPDGRRILFVSNRDGDDDLYTMHSDGTNVRRLTENRAADLTPRWSPDGRSIAFASDRARRGEPEIWLMRADGTGAHRLVRTQNHPTWQDFQFSPTWSPDGRQVIFSMPASDGNPELYRVGVDGRGLTRLTRTAGNSERLGDDTMPDWSLGRVVFTSNREGASSDLWMMRPDGSGQEPLARRPGSDDWHPRLSPLGEQIAFTRLEIKSNRSSIWIANTDGSEARRVADGTEPDWRPRTRATG